MTPDPTRDDLQFLRQISEQGRYAPLISGRYLVLWGSLISVAYFFQYGILSGKFGWPGYSLMIMWAIVMVTSTIAMIWFGKTIRRKPGLGAIGNKVDHWNWTAVGLSIAATFAGALIAVVFTGADPMIFDVIIIVALAGYGTAFLTCANIANVPWLRWPAIGAFCSTAIVMSFIGNPVIYLISSFIILGVAVLPGVILMMAEPASLPAEEVA